MEISSQTEFADVLFLDDEAEAFKKPLQGGGSGGSGGSGSGNGGCGGSGSGGCGGTGPSN